MNFIGLSSNRPRPNSKVVLRGFCRARISATRLTIRSTRSVRRNASDGTLRRPPASKSESQQQSEHEHDQQCCRDRDYALCGEMQPPEADLQSIAHSMALHLKKTESLGGTIYLPADLRVRQQGICRHVPKHGTWRLQQRLDAAQQSAVLPIRCVSGAPDGWLRCPQLISGRLARRRHWPTRRSDGSPF